MTVNSGISIRKWLNRSYYVLWRKMFRLLWNLPRITYCDFLSTINSSLPMDISLENRCSKFVWASLNSDNKVVKMVTLSSIKAARSVLGDNYRYLSHNYSINFNDWFGSYNVINDCINHFITQYVDCPQYAYIERDLCYFIDYVDQFVLTSTGIVQLIEYLCTIYISKLISLGDIISYLYYKTCILLCF